jgi:uncharacterized protein YceH (UPF0502 family)
LKQDEIREFQNNIEFAKEVLKAKTMTDFDDLEDARESLEKLSNKKKALANHFSKNSKLDKYQVRTTFLLLLFL